MRQKLPTSTQILIFLAWSYGTTALHVYHFHQPYSGDYDTHYGIVRAEDGVIEQDVTYEGSAVPDRIKLSKRRKRDRYALACSKAVPHR